MKSAYITGILSGAFTAAVGGFARNLGSLGAFSGWDFGIILWDAACFLVPLAGGLLGCTAPLIASHLPAFRAYASPLEQRSLEDSLARQRTQNRLIFFAFLGGILAGMLTTLLFLPIGIHD